MAPVTVDDAKTAVARSREEQGLPPVVDDPKTIERLAALLDRAPETGT